MKCCPVVSAHLISVLKQGSHESFYFSSWLLEVGVACSQALSLLFGFRANKRVRSQSLPTKLLTGMLVGILKMTPIKRD